MGYIGKKLETKLYDVFTRDEAIQNSTPAAVSDKANNSTGYFDLPAGTTLERPASPTTGMLRFNTDLNYLEQYTNEGWKGIATPPIVSSVDNTEVGEYSAQTFVINGSSFDTTSTAFLVDSENNTITPTTSTRNSSEQITIVFSGNDIISDDIAQPLSVKVINGSGLNYVLDGVIQINATPSWNTTPGSILSTYEGESIDTSVSASDPEGNTITYSVASGSLPSGCSLDSNTGAITGEAPMVSSTTTYNFSITASDTFNNIASRDFSILIENEDFIWDYESGSIGEDYTERVSSFNVSGSFNSGSSVTYSVVAGSLADGHTLDTSTGAISGTASGVSDYSQNTYNVTIRATSDSTGQTFDRDYSYVIKSRYVGYNCFVNNSESGSVYSTAPDGMIFTRIDFASYGQPGGSCPNYTYGSCHASSSMSITESYALGNNSFSFSNGNGMFGDPCGGASKYYYGKFTYGPF